MGTNFYWITEPEAPKSVIATTPTGDEIEVSTGFFEDGPIINIGKRSAAGLYCWDCDETLCPGGKAAIHQGGSESWPDACPKCGKGRTDEGLKDGNPAGVELGFSRPRDDRPTGVRGCSSFTWAQDPDKARRACEANMDREVVRNEYGDRFTGGQFLRMLRANCTIEFMHSIGREFC